MHCHPEIIFDRRNPRARISVILIDWGVRESFHSLHYLSQQTVPRNAYELIWLEFYDHKPEGLRQMVASAGEGAALLDRWLVLGYPRDTIYNKHRLYNIGILAAQGDICVICDSDAIFRPTFIEKLLAAFAETPRAVIHLDEVRNFSPRFYPFNYPSLDEVVGDGCINWWGTVTRGLANSPDKLHQANYGACMAARRQDLIAVGGSDEHLDYLGYQCGPYDMTFRLVNAGHQERWLSDEFLYHTWHPNQTGINTDFQGPHDGLYMALRALEARVSGRVQPHVVNPWIEQVRRGERLELEALLRLVAERAEPAWATEACRPDPHQQVYWVERDWGGFNIYYHDHRWYALAEGHPVFDPDKARRGGYRWLLQAESKEQLQVLLGTPLGQAILFRDVSSPGRLWKKVRLLPWWRLPDRLLGRLWKTLAGSAPPLGAWSRRPVPQQAGKDVPPSDSDLQQENSHGRAHPGHRRLGLPGQHPLRTPAGRGLRRPRP